jgi:hypothetical protein
VLFVKTLMKRVGLMKKQMPRLKIYGGLQRQIKAPK